MSNGYHLHGKFLLAHLLHRIWLLHPKREKKLPFSYAVTEGRHLNNKVYTCNTFLPEINKEEKVSWGIP